MGRGRAIQNSDIGLAKEEVRRGNVQNRVVCGT